MRITKTHLLEDFERLKKHTTLNLGIEWASEPRRPRIYATDTGGDVRDLSPRLPMGQMHLWMEAFDDGFSNGHAVGYVQCDVRHHKEHHKGGE